MFNAFRIKNRKKAQKFFEGVPTNNSNPIFFLLVKDKRAFSKLKKNYMALNI